MTPARHHRGVRIIRRLRGSQTALTAAQLAAELGVTFAERSDLDLARVTHKVNGALPPVLREALALEVA